MLRDRRSSYLSWHQLPDREQNYTFVHQHRSIRHHGAVHDDPHRHGP